MHNKKWIIKNNDSNIISNKLSPLLNKILFDRGYRDINSVDKFLHPTLHDLYDPYLMDDMDRVVEKIYRYVNDGKNICIYGDYDVDGITSIAVLVKCFERLGVDVDYYIPNRLDEGYGLSIDALDNVIKKGADLIISVDCGITSVKEAEYVKNIGKELIITDHHHPHEVLPDTLILNPKKNTCLYPYDMLAGVGIAMKLTEALLGEDFKNFYKEILPIVMLGTVADVAPIQDENRIITKLGLHLLKETDNIGLLSLIEVSGLSGKDINTGHIGFNIAPKINAAGRIGKPELGVELLITRDESKAIKLSNELNELNIERKSIENDILERVDILIRETVNPLDKIIIVKGENFHSGVIGIVASRITEKYSKPSIILTTEDGIAKGSGRSYGDINLFDMVNSAKEHMISFGGHDKACGLSVKEENVELIKSIINKYADDTLKKEDLLDKIIIDSSINSDNILFSTIDEINMLEPFGLGNSRPVFIYKNLIIDRIYKMGEFKNHLKLVLNDGNRTFDAVGFNIAEKYSFLKSGNTIDMALTLSKNEFRGIETIQFMIKDIRILNSLFYKDSDIADKFNISFARSIFYNALIEENDCIIDFKSVNRLDYIFNNKNRLILVNSFDNLIKIMFKINDLNRDDISISYNKIEGNSDIHIVVNPIYTALNYDYDEVILYDIPYDKNHIGFLKDRVKKLTILSSIVDEQSQINQLYTSIPHRLDLVDVYKYLLKEELTKINIKDLSKILKMSIIKCEVSLLLLRTLKLIDIEEKDVYYIKVLPKPKEKLELDQTDIFSSISNALNKFISVVDILKNQIGDIYESKR